MSVEPKGRKIDGESPRSCFIRPPKRRATSVIAAQTSNINPKQLHDRNSAVAQAQQDGCTGNFRIFDSPFGNFLVPVIPTPAELAGSDNPSMLLSKVWNLSVLEDNRVEQGYVIEPESPLLEGLAKMLAVSMANPNLFFLRHCPQENKACSSAVFIQERRMIDRFRIWAKGGDGGNGCNSIRRSRHDRRGRPDGGNGGRGGDVILECSPTMWDLSALQHHINAKRGGNGSSKNMIGSRGADKVIQVPVGIVIHLVEGELPSAVEKSSSSKLDPWEIPGTVDTDSSEFSTQSISADQTSSKVEKKVKSCGRRASRGEEYSTPRTQIFGLPTNSRTTCSIASDKFESDDDDLSDWEEESCGQMEDPDGDDIMGTECEDELEETELIEYNVAELTEQGQRIVVARGGEGGLGNLSMRKASKMMQKGANSDDEVSDDYDHASPSVGLPGSEVVLVLELKSIADVGLIGMPNAGKSTLLGALSKAKPVVGDYAFTTLRPNLGNVNYYDFSLTVADIPGLIRGAHENRGLGHAFLRHIERTKVLAYVVDLAAALGDNKGIPPWEQLNDLILELEYYSEGLSDRPSLVVANKVDEDGAEEVYKELKRRVSGVPVFPVSAILEEGVPELKDGLRMLISGEQTHRLKLDGIVLHQNAASVSI